MPIHIIFDGPPSHESGRFVEVEDDNGKSICIGEWNHTPGKLWELVIPDYKAERDALAAENMRLREALEQWEWSDQLFDDGETHITYCPACGKLQRDGHEVDCWMKAALSPQPPTASPSEPKGDSELERRIQKLEQMVDASSECCQLCNAYIRWNGEGHKPDCPYLLLARKLRGPC